jgi:SAM-dependent methyltransferase
MVEIVNGPARGEDQHMTSPAQPVSHTCLENEDGRCLIDELSGGYRRVTVVPKRPDLVVPVSTCETSYPVWLIEEMLHVRGLGDLCDEIAREENECQRSITSLVSAYCTPIDLDGKRLLDFGCGAGASTVVLGRLFGTAEVIGVDLDRKRVALANARLQFRGLKNARALASPGGDQLPLDIGQFDLVFMNAVYEHLLPRERVVVMPRLWAALRHGGVLLLTDTPHRWFPVEAHSTCLPLVNFLPDRMALLAARTLAGSKSMINRSPSWEEHLRGGIRGATEREVLQNLQRGSQDRAILLSPTKQGLSDRVDFWHSCLSTRRYRTVKSLLRLTLKGIYRVTGTVYTQNLSLAIQKASS